MPVTRERFAQGMTYDEYKAQMTRNRERFDENEGEIQLDSADVAAFQNLPQSLNVLVLAEDWCGDVINNLPILGRLAQASGKLNPRVFLRDQNPDLMDQYLNRGEFRSIPVFAFFDQDFAEIGHFIERPESVTERQAAFKRQFFGDHPDLGTPETPISQLTEDARLQYTEAMAAFREQIKAQDRADVVRDLRSIVEQVPAQ